MTQSRLRYKNRTYYRSQKESFKPYMYSIFGIVFVTFFGFGAQNLAITINTFGEKNYINEANLCAEWSKDFALTNTDCSDPSQEVRFGNYLDSKPAVLEQSIQRSTN